MSRRNRRGRANKSLPSQLLQANVNGALTPVSSASGIYPGQSNQGGAATPLFRDLFPYAFGPGVPFTPAPLDPTRRDSGRAQPRFNEYPVSWNLPGSSHRTVPWNVLRDAAKIPLIRNCIRIRKNEVASLPWKIVISERAVQAEQRRSPGMSTDDIEQKLRDQFLPEIERLEKFWQYPDLGNGRDWADWISLAMEEHLVLDALAVYPRLNYGGECVALEIIDGSTVKPLLDHRGGRPAPPQAAYQQILWGFPRGEYQASLPPGFEEAPVGDVDSDARIPGGYPSDALIYERKEHFTWSPYGLSAVEQSLVDADLWMKRMAWLRAEYTEGTMPSSWLEIAEGTQAASWSMTELREVERELNDHYSGSTANRHRQRLLPPGVKPVETTEVAEKYKPDYDLYLLKLMVANFDTTIAELGFTESKGLGDSGYHEGAADVRWRRGVRPDTEWLANILTKISQCHLNAPPELDFKFLSLDAEDEAAETELAHKEFAVGALTMNELRERKGKAPYQFDEADKPMIVTTRGLIFVEGASKMAMPGVLLEPASQRMGDPASSQTPPGNAPDGAGDTSAAVAAATKSVDPNSPAAVQVYAQMLKSYPAESITWVLSQNWEWPKSVALDDIDFSADREWRASREPDVVERKKKKILDGDIKPVVMVQNAGSDLYRVIDGHHRALAYKQLGVPVVAWTFCTTDPTGPWDTVHEDQYGEAGRGSDTSGKTELSAYRTWAKKPHSRPFQFDHVTQAVAKASGVDLDRVTFKAGGADPKASRAKAPRSRSGLVWHGWSKDQEAARLWAKRLSSALTGKIDTNSIATEWLRVRGKADNADASIFLGDQNGAIHVIIGDILNGIYADGMVVGQQAAKALVASLETVDWANWSPGDMKAAYEVLGVDGGRGLQAMLEQAGVTINSISAGRFDELAARLAEALQEGWSSDQLARSLRDVLEDPQWADMVAQTEMTRAVSAATLNTYAEQGVTKSLWMTAIDDRVCVICEGNEAQGPVPVGEAFESGDDQPPAHPLCRCALGPDLDSIDVTALL